ncbi:MAG: HAD family hydrolase [Acidimicrobiaceae bacterium]|nr:HAD family hydrolase [Acidimicrobiaceae bacterium]
MTAAGSPSVVLFDWNGTLLDDMERARMASSLIREQWAGLPGLTLEEFREAWCLPLSDHVRRLGVPDDRREDAARAWSTHLAALDAPLSPGASATLEALLDEGITIGVVSSANDEAVRRDLRDHGLDRRFDSIHCGVIQKGDVVSRYVEGAPAGAVWYVGDTRFDMVQARGAGSIAIGYTAGYDAADALHDGGAHHLIDRLEDLIALIARAEPDRR